MMERFGEQEKANKQVEAPAKKKVVKEDKKKVKQSKADDQKKEIKKEEAKQGKSPALKEYHSVNAVDQNMMRRVAG